jgi:choline-sulfatase
MVSAVPRNVLFLMSDQHSPFVSGMDGNGAARTPNLDRLAERGTRFDGGYTNSPICVPARAALATGRFAHTTGNYDNASPYLGTEADSWGHRASAAGAVMTTFGKLHFRHADDPTGYDDQRSPLHVRDGVGDLTHALRDRQPRLTTLREAARNVVVGESEYTRYDRDVARQATEWLTDGSIAQGQCWAAMVSMVTPHYPFVVPREYLDRHPLESLSVPTRSDPDSWDRHPALEWSRHMTGFDEPMTYQETMRSVQAYYALVSFMDDRIGEVLDALERSGHADDTVVIYTSDHGELCGTDGLWFKCTMQEPSVRVPMLLAGPGVPSGQVRQTPVSLVDVFPTVIDALGAEPDPRDRDLPGMSLLTLANGPDDPERVAFSEYHSANSKAGSFMIRSGRWKYVFHAAFPAQLFDLAADPTEANNVAGDPNYAEALATCHELLTRICDPVAVDEQIRAEQARKVEEYGGVEAVAAGFPIMAYSPAPKT